MTNDLQRQAYPDGSGPMIEANRLANLAQIAQWYYEQDLSLSDIAKRLDRSVSRVSRMLRDARALGIVEIRIKHPTFRNHQLEEQLERRFGLRRAFVFASTEGAGHAGSLRRLGQLAADALSGAIAPASVVGVGWGSHVHAVVAALRPVVLEPGLVVQVSGSIGSTDPSTDGAQISQALALKLNFVARTLPAPLIVASEAMAQSLRENPVVTDTLQLAAKAHLVLIGVGTPLAPQGGLRRAGYLHDDEASALVAAGAVGDVIGYHLDEAGRVLDTDLNRRIIGIGPDVLQTIADVVVVAHGPEKVVPLRAALRGGYIKQVISDEATAGAILQAA